jgi:hypothetical protein
MTEVGGPVKEKPSELEQMEILKKECSMMVRLLKQSETEETELSAQNKILAREALLCGFDPAVLEPPAPKRRKPAVKKL